LPKVSPIRMVKKNPKIRPSNPVMDTLALSLLTPLFRRYDGLSEAERYLTKFDQTRVEVKRDEKWAVENLDRFLDGAANFWWQSNQVRFEDQLANMPAADVWTEVKAEMSAFFTKEVQKEEAKRKLRETRFNIGDDPLLYVTQRTRYLNLAEPHLEEKDRVNRLIEGLPTDLRLSVMYARSKTVQEFTDNLRDLLHHSFLGKTLTKLQHNKPPEKRSNNNYFSRSKVNDDVRYPAERELQSFRTADDKPICFGCGKPNHVMRHCRINNKIVKFGPYARKPAEQSQSKQQPENPAQNAEN